MKQPTSKPRAFKHLFRAKTGVAICLLWCTAAAASGQPNPSAPAFEGELIYRSYEYNNALIRKLSMGNSYNGARTTRILLKDQAAHIVDEGLHLHTIIDRNTHQVWVYSDVTRTGLRSDDTFLTSYLSANDPAVDTGTAKTSTLTTAEAPVEYKGAAYRVYKGSLAFEDFAETDIEMWYSETMPCNQAYRYFLSGLPVPGIIRRGIMNYSGRLPLLGAAKTTTAIELVAYSEHPVGESLMRPPSDIRTEELTKPGQLVKFYKENVQELKKQQLYPETMKVKEVSYLLRDQWDFADQWVEKRIEPGAETLTWAKVADEAAKLTGELADNLRKTDANPAEERVGEEQEEDLESLDPERRTIYRKYKNAYQKCADMIKKAIDAYYKQDAKFLEQGANNKVRLGFNQEMWSAVTKYRKQMRKIQNDCFNDTGRYIPRDYQEYRPRPNFVHTSILSE